jgi:hypothetical protein
MQSEIRLKRKNLITNATNAYYSFLLICISIPGATTTFNIDLPQNIVLMLSIALLVSSVFLQGERYAERAAAFKQSYLEFQTLYNDSSKTDEEKMREYYTKLANCENQSDADYRSAVVSAQLNGKTLKNSNGPIECTIPIMIKYVIDNLIWISVSLLITFAPFLWVRLENG